MAQLLTMLPASRTLNFLIFAVCTSMILIALYMEHVMMLQPCGLCITQRVFVILVGLVCLAAALHNPPTSTRRNYAFLAASLCVAGGYFAGRQIWLQHLPEDQVPACGPGLSYIMDNFPLADALSFLLKGDGNCAEVTWRFLGIFSIAELSMIGFVVLFFICIFQGLRRA